MEINFEIIEIPWYHFGGVNFEVNKSPEKDQSICQVCWRLVGVVTVMQMLLYKIQLL